MTPNPSESDLAAAVEQLRSLKREDIILRSDIAALTTVLAALGSAQRDGKRLEALNRRGGKLIFKRGYPNKYGGNSFVDWEGFDESLDASTLHGCLDKLVATMSKEPPL